MPSELEVPNPAPAPDEQIANPLHSPTSATVATPTPAPLHSPTSATVVKADDISTLPESWQAEIKSLRKEAADKRSKLTAYEKQEDERKAATLSDIERANETATKATERAAALEAKLLAKEAMAALERAHMIDAELAFLAIKDKIVTENGEATNLADLVAELVKARPHLVKAAATERPTPPDTRSTSPSATPPAPSRGRVPGKI